MYYVYIIQNEQKQLYTGYTSDLRRRIKEHNRGISKSTRNSKWELIYYEAYKSEKDARLREKQLKRSSGSKRWLKSRIKNSMNS
jgi:putative endonuclease